MNDWRLISPRFSSIQFNSSRGMIRLTFISLIKVWQRRPHTYYILILRFASFCTKTMLTPMLNTAPQMMCHDSSLTVLHQSNTNHHKTKYLVYEVLHCCVRLCGQVLMCVLSKLNLLFNSLSYCSIYIAGIWCPHMWQRHPHTLPRV